MNDLLQVDTIAGNGVCVVAVEGEIDLSNAGHFEEQLAAATESETRVVVDLIRCSYIDSSGLNALVRATREARDESEIVLVAGTETRRILEVAGLETLFVIFPSRDEALLETLGAGQD